MADSDVPLTPTTPLLLPDEIHWAIRPGTALLRLETTSFREGLLDGAWWPRTRDIVTELPALISVLTEHLGPITRVGVDASAWNYPPARLVVDGRVVHLVSDPVGDDTVLVTRGHNDDLPCWWFRPARTTSRPPLGPSPLRGGIHVVKVFLILVIVAMVLGIIGAAVEGMLYLLFIGILVLVAALVYLGMHGRRSGRRHIR